MTGEAASTNRDGFVPAQNSMKNRIAMNTMALPKSGCLSTSRQGKAAIRPGIIRSRSVAGASRSVASQRASIRIVASFASSAGCPKRCPPIAIHDLLLAAVPAPVPMKSVSRRRNNPIAYTNGVAHSSIRGEVRKVRTATIRLRPNQTTCRCQIVATNVGTSVWPAEYSVASPYNASAPTEMTSALSSWRTRDSTVDRNDGRKGIGQHRNLERRRSGIVGEGDFHLRRRALVDAEVVRDGPRHERRHTGAVLVRLDDRSDHDLRFVRRREADEPAVIESVRIL